MDSVILPKELHGVSAKIARADQSIENLNSLINTLIASNSRLHTVHKHFENDFREFVISASGVAVPVPVDIPIVAGEVLYQLRSALDHLIVALAHKHSGPHRRKLQYPVCKEKEKFDQFVKNKNKGIPGISPSSARIIEESQPFNEVRPETNFLSILHDLNIIDKHRILLVVNAAHCIGDKVIINSQEPASILDFKVGPIGIIGDKRIEICRIFLQEPQPAFDADAEVIIKVAFPDLGGVGPVPVTDALRVIRNATADLVARFIPEFS